MSEEHAHIVPYKTFMGIWIALLILTGITVWVAQYNSSATRELAARRSVSEVAKPPHWWSNVSTGRVEVVG